jgi:hypothetical protein
MIFPSIYMVLSLGMLHRAQAQTGSLAFWTGPQCTGTSSFPTNQLGECFNLDGPAPPAIAAGGTTGELIICVAQDCQSGPNGDGCQSFPIPTGCLTLFEGATAGSMMMA